MFPITQKPPQYLAGRRLQSDIDELDPACNPFVSCLSLFHVPKYTLANAYGGFFLPSCGLDHERFGYFPCRVIGHQDESTVRYRMVVEKIGFELGAGNLVTLSVIRQAVSIK